MKNLEFDYYMQIDYSEVVSKCNFTIKCIPQNTERQKIESMQIDIFPKASYLLGKDGLNNQQIIGCVDADHTTFYYHIRGKAVIGNVAYEENEDTNLSMIFNHPHGLNVPGEKIKNYFKKLQKSIENETTKFHKAVAIMHLLHRDYQYCPYITDMYTNAEEAFSCKKGVCQDYAHIFISLLHLAGIPARYVVGLIVGEGASHAWVEILENGKWYGLDPTNDKVVNHEYIKIGVGRDAGDCQINRGIMRGGGLHFQKINVNVKEIEDEL